MSRPRSPRQRRTIRSPCVLGEVPTRRPPRAGRVARLRGDLDPPLLETLRLLVTELVTNSVKHAEADTVNLRVPGARVGLDRGEGRGAGVRPLLTGTPRDDRGGWGLFLVERLSDRWGTARDSNGTRVWFELRRG